MPSEPGTPETRTVTRDQLADALHEWLEPLINGVMHGENVDCNCHERADAIWAALSPEEPARTESLRAELLSWIAAQRAKPWSDGSFASRLTGEEGYDAALDELEYRLR